MPCEYWPTRRARSGSSPTARIASAQRVVVSDSVEPGEVAQVLHAAHFVIEQRRMRHVADLLADVVKLGGAENRDAALAGLHQSGERAQQRGLARAVVAENGVELPAANSAVTPRRAAKRPNCLIRFVTVMTGAGAVAVSVIIGLVRLEG